MAESGYRQVIVPLLLLALMVLSVVGIAYSSGTNNTQAQPTGSAQESFSYNGYDFEFQNSRSGGLYRTTVSGEPVQFRTRPQSIQRFSIPSSFSNILNGSQVEVVAPAPTTGAREQDRFAAQQLANDLASRLPVTATMVTEANPSCTDTPRILVQQNTTQNVLEKTGEQCYQTSTTDQSIFIISDYLVYEYYGIL